MDVFLVSRVHLVAPLARLAVQIIPSGERAARQEVMLDEMERALKKAGTYKKTLGANP